jgi:hypothetical protein
VHLQSLSSGELSKFTVEGPERQVTGLSSHLEDETVGEAHGRLLSVVRERSFDGIGILNDELPVGE